MISSFIINRGAGGANITTPRAPVSDIINALAAYSFASLRAELLALNVQLLEKPIVETASTSITSN